MYTFVSTYIYMQGRSQEYEEGGAGLYARIARGEKFWTTPTIWDHAY